MAPRSRPSKEHRARRRAAAERTARRDSLLVLLSRIQRTVPVAPTEAALLRAHVDAELADADQARAALGHQEAQHRQQLAAAHAAIREAEQEAADLREQLLAYRAVEAQRQADRQPTAQHTGGNAEDCPACSPNPPYPFLCPGAAGTRADRVRAFLAEQTAHLTTPEKP